MADEPIPELGDKTPMEVANTPTMDWLASHGRVGRLKTVPVGYHPGSEVANMSVLGYDLDKTFEGRGSLEAASIGVPLLEGEMAMRCNLICIENGIIKNHSAGHISNEEAAELIDFLNEQLADDGTHAEGADQRRVAGGAVQLVLVALEDPVVEGLPEGTEVARAEDARVGGLGAELPEVLVGDRGAERDRAVHHQVRRPRGKQRDEREREGLEDGDPTLHAARRPTVHANEHVAGEHDAQHEGEDRDEVAKHPEPRALGEVHAQEHDVARLSRGKDLAVKQVGVRVHEAARADDGESQPHGNLGRDGRLRSLHLTSPRSSLETTELHPRARAHAMSSGSQNRRSCDYFDSLEPKRPLV